MKHALEYGPASVAVAAGNDCWRFYKDGILSAANNCPTQIDHGVVVVAVYIAGEDNGDDSDPEPVTDSDTEPDTDTDVDSDTDGDDTDGDEPNSDFDEEIAMIRRCKKTTRAERTNNMCEQEDAFIAPNNIGEPGKKCCWYKHI